MSILSSLTLGAYNPDTLDPVAVARENMLKALRVQLESAKAMVEGKPYLLTRKETKTDPETGEVTKVDVKYPLRKWYYRDQAGVVRLNLKHSNKKLEVQKGKTDIIVGDDKELPATIELVMKAIEAGELDAVLDAAIKAKKPRKSHKK